MHISMTMLLHELLKNYHIVSLCHVWCVIAEILAYTRELYNFNVYFHEFKLKT